MRDILHAKLKIMLAEDHRDTREAIMKWFGAHGYAARAAPDVRSCLALDECEPCDVLVCDLILPDGNGWDLMRELSGRHRLVGIAASGRSAAADRARSREVGFIEHLVKPFTFQALAAALELASGHLARTEVANETISPRNRD
ncbi:MAG TPA: response regulator [Lacunisphaera sp.]|jgi:DNA-binding response OmpR family regulator|nr:response regulator [Lacunisphaera sp.]